MFPDGALRHGNTGRLVIVTPDLSNVDAVPIPAEEVLVGGKLLGFVEVLDEDNP